MLNTLAKMVAEGAGQTDIRSRPGWETEVDCEKFCTSACGP